MTRDQAECHLLLASQTIACFLLISRFVLFAQRYVLLFFKHFRADISAMLFIKSSNTPDIRTGCLKLAITILIINLVLVIMSNLPEIQTFASIL